MFLELRPIRERLKLTQAEAAVAAGVSRLTYIKWEANQDTMPIGKYREVLEFYKKLSSVRERG